MAAVRGIVAVCCALLALAVPGCGSSRSGGLGVPGPATLQGAKQALHEYFSAAKPCALMTQHGRAVLLKLGGPKACQALKLRDRAPVPIVGPVGAGGDLALAYFRDRGKRASEPGGGVAVVRRRDGRWLVDFPGPMPIPPSIPARGVSPASRYPLPTTGPSIRGALGAASRYTDSQVARGSDRVHVAAATVVGDVALAYQVAGSDVPGTATAPPQPGLNGVLLLTKHPAGWHMWHPNSVTIG
jgi:hypothetical protein